MIFFVQDVPLFSPVTMSQAAEREIISTILAEKFLPDPSIQRLLASYPFTEEAERNRVILDLMELFWKKQSLSSLFVLLRDFDAVFAALGKKGHFVHQFEVFIFGWYLIRHLFSHALFTSIKAENMFSTWLLTSSGHDFGYPISTAKSVITQFAELYEKFGMHGLADKYRSIEENYSIISEDALCRPDIKTRQNKEIKIDILKFVADSIKSTLGIDDSLNSELWNGLITSNSHGYVGATLLCNSHLKFLHAHRKKLPEDIERLKLASSAIALHDLKEDYQHLVAKIDFYRNPYAYILYFVDNLHEWHRNLRPNEQYPSYNLQRIATKVKQVDIHYLLSHSKWTPEIEDNSIQYLENKRDLLSFLSPPLPALDCKLVMHFNTNHDLQIDDLVISL